MTESRCIKNGLAAPTTPVHHPVLINSCGIHKAIMIPDNIYGTCKVALITLEISTWPRRVHTFLQGRSPPTMRYAMSLERDHLYAWVVFNDEHLVGTYEDFQVAAAEAVRRFGRGPYLIRQVGTAPLMLPTVFGLRQVGAGS